MHYGWTSDYNGIIQTVLTSWSTSSKLFIFVHVHLLNLSVRPPKTLNNMKSHFNSEKVGNSAATFS